MRDTIKNDTLWGIRVRTRGLDACAWRRFALPPSMPLAGVHRCIQEAFDLSNSGLYSFESAEVRVGVLGQDLYWMGEDAERWDVTRMTLAELLAAPPCSYTYQGVTCVVERDELPAAHGVVEGEHDLVSSTSGWRVQRRGALTRDTIDLADVARDARQRAGLDGVTMWHFVQRGEVGGDAAEEASSAASPPTSPRGVSPPEVLSPEELVATIMQGGERWRTREELELLVSRYAHQSQKTHDLYIRQLAAGELWRARLPLEEDVVVEMQDAGFSDESIGGVEETVPRSSPEERFAHVDWTLPSHPSLKLVLKRLPVAKLDELVTRFGIELGGRRQAREALLIDAMCDVEGAMERALDWRGEAIEAVEFLCRDRAPVLVEEVLGVCGEEVLEALVARGVVFLGKYDERGVHALIPAEMVQVWRLVLGSI